MEHFARHLQPHASHCLCHTQLFVPEAISPAQAVDALFDLNLTTVPENTACEVKKLVESL